MSNFTDNNEVIATAEEFEEAYKGLSEADNKRLYAYAAHRVKILTGGSNPDDIIRDIYYGTLQGTRNWKKSEVDVFGHILNTITSITSNMRSKACAMNHLRRESTDPIYEESKSIDNHPSNTPDLEANIDAKNKIDKIRNLFDKDNPKEKLILDIMNCIAEDFRGPEIMVILDITQTQFDSAKRQLKRKTLFMREQ